MDVKIALALLLIQVATSFSRSLHRGETSKELSLDNSYHDPRIAQLLSMLDDTSLESSEDLRKLVRILPVNSEEEYPRNDKTRLVELATLRRKSKKPLAIILSTSDLKNKEFSRRKIHVSKEVAKEDAMKEETKQDSIEESLMKDDLTQEDLSTEEVKSLTKEETAEDATKEELTNALTTEDLTAEHLIKEESSEGTSEDSTNELTKEDLTLEKSDKLHKSDINLTQEELTEENATIEKSKSTASDTTEDTAENSLSETEDTSEEKHDLTAKDKPDSYADIIEIGKLLIENQNENESIRNDRSEQYDNGPVIQRHVNENQSKSVVADVWEVENGKRSNDGQLHRTYNLSFLFNRK